MSRDHRFAMLHRKLQNSSDVRIDPQQELNEESAEFWNELCDSGLARSLGISDVSTESLVITAQK